MRQIIAMEVASDLDAYNEAMLGKPNAEYCAWIQQPSSWGGAIEVNILYAVVATIPTHKNITIRQM
jgi:ubiquitin thioesterase OTU1